MPKMLDDIHEAILKTYINNKKTRSQKKSVHAWLKMKNETISPVIIETFPYISS